MNNFNLFTLGQGQFIGAGKGQMNAGIKTSGGGYGSGKMKASCMIPPSAPNHATLQCSEASKSCKATCANEYKFPNGHSVLYISCVDNEWTVKDSEWGEIPSCERNICNKFINLNTPGFINRILFQPFARPTVRTMESVSRPGNALVPITSTDPNANTRRNSVCRSRTCHRIPASPALPLSAQ